MAAQGMSQRQISKKTGLSKSGIQRLLARAARGDRMDYKAVSEG